MADVTRESSTLLRARHRHARLEVEDWLYANCSEVRQLDRADVQTIRKGMVGGWRVKLEVTGGPRIVDIMVPDAFPFQAPRIRLVDLPADEDWPHVESDNVLCLVPETASFDPDDPAGGVIALLNMVVELSDLVAAGGADEEFRSEVLSYWANRIPGGRKEIISIADPTPVSRLVSVWNGPIRRVLADTPEVLLQWLHNRYPVGQKFKFDVGALLWLGDPLTVGQFPRTARDILELAEAAGATDILSKAAASVSGDLVVGLGMNTTNGVAVAGLTIPRPPPIRGRDLVHHGFRPGKTPLTLVTKRFFGSAGILRADWKRADHSWIHGRDQDQRAAGLKNKKVVVFGCGSIGAPIAVALAQAGIGKFVFVDHDVLNPSNLSRHPLGAQYLGLFKAEGLAAKLKQDLPHLRIQTLVKRMEEVLMTAGNLSNVDLIVSAVGDWGAEAMLDAWSEASGRPVPIVFGWTEAHACAGHAVAVMKNGAAFRDGFDPTGLPQLRVTEFASTTVRQEPACGAVFQPYGPIELQGSIAAIAELALDALLKPPTMSTHRIWVGRERHLSQVGGKWSNTWSKLAGERSEGGFLFERPWAKALEDRTLAA